MVKFEKVIVQEGKFRQWNEHLKQFEMVEVTPERLKKLRDNFQKQLGLGMKIPAPWKHDFNITTLSTGENGLLDDSTANAGFWETLEIKTLPKSGKQGLVGVIDVPGDPKDPETPAGKIGTSVKDTSIYTRRNLPITSGVDKEEFLDEGVMHIALVTHPIELGQENFKLLKDNDLHLVMSNMVSDDEPSEKTESEEDSENGLSLLPQLIDDLKNVCKLFLPANTSIDNLAENLSIAVGQYKLMNSSEDGSGVKTDSFQVEPLLMSHLDSSQVEALIQAKVINPKTGKAYAKEDFSPNPQQPDTQTQLVMSAMQNSMQADRRKGYRTRIEHLVSSGRTTKAFADTNLYPQADAYNIEFKDGSVSTPMIESLIMSLESIPAPERTSHTLVMGSGVTDSDGDNTDVAELEDYAKYMARLI